MNIYSSMFNLFIALFCFFFKISFCLEYELIRRFPHVSRLFTQGLVYHNGYIYESAGMYGESSLAVIHPDTGKILKEVEIDAKLFGEGMEIIDDIVYVLTWREHIVLLYDAEDLKYIGSLPFKSHTGEGWGLTHNPRTKQLILSDGSGVITFYKQPHVEVIKSVDISNTVSKKYIIHSTELVKVREILVTNPRAHKAVSKINELEFVFEDYSNYVEDSHLTTVHSLEKDARYADIGGVIYANVWYKDEILVIKAITGEILHTYDFSNLFPQSERMATPSVTTLRGHKHKLDCFNGIAYNKTDASFLLTGKWWPNYYKVKMNHHVTVQDAVLTDIESSLNPKNNKRKHHIMRMKDKDGNDMIL